MICVDNNLVAGHGTTLLLKRFYDAGLHFVGGRVGEGEGKNLRWMDPILGDHAGNPLGQDRRFPDPGSC